jgi:O-antigen/teichoic acid export membrane protein
MSQIRRQSIISSVMVYVGFALGFFNTYLFTREGGFSKEEYGLVGIFIAIASLLYAAANLGMPSYIYKFFPYYQGRLPNRKNDLFTWALLVTLAGYLLITVAGIWFRDLIILKFGKHSPLLVDYFYWIFPLGFGLTLFSLLEAYAWQLGRPVFTNFLREVLFRLLTTGLIVLTLTRFIASYDTFIKFYSFSYLVIACCLLFFLLYRNELAFTTRISRVTRRFRKKIITLASFVYGGSLIYALSLIFDSLVIASVLPDGLADVAVFTLGQYMANLIQAPQRGIIASAMGPLSLAWKEKNMDKIRLIYKRSSINQLIFSAGMFGLIWLNFTDGIHTFQLQQGYLDARWVFFWVGLYRIIDMGTGVSSQIISTSTLWRFEFYTGVVLLVLTLPLTYVMTKYTDLGILGPPIASFISFVIYNGIRYFFLLRKFKLQPFSSKTGFTLLLTLTAYLVCHFLMSDKQGLLWICLRSFLYLLIFIAGVVQLKLTEDLGPVMRTIWKRLGLG